MSLFDFLPTIVYHIFVLVGVIGILVLTLTDWLLPFSKYLIWVKAVVYGLIIVGLLGTGFNISDTKWKLKYAEIENKNLELKAQNEKLKTDAANKTIEVVTRFITKDRIIERNGNEIVNNVDKYVTKKDDSSCTINDGFIRLFNDSVDNTTSRVPDSTKGTDDKAGTTEEVTGK